MGGDDDIFEQEEDGVQRSGVYEVIFAIVGLLIAALVGYMTLRSKDEPAPVIDTPRPRAQHECLDDPPCAASAFFGLANAERDVGNAEAQRQALVIAKSLETRDCSGANQIWFIGYQRRGASAVLVDAQRGASRAIEAACPLE